MNLITLLTVPNIIAAFLMLNIWTFMLFGIDKIRAEEGPWRISEGTLLAWAFFSEVRLVSMQGRALFKHKTRKQPFASNLYQTAILHAIAAALAGGWFLP